MEVSSNNRDGQEQAIDCLINQCSLVSGLTEQIRHTRRDLAIGLLRVFTLQQTIWSEGTDRLRLVCHGSVTGRDIDLAHELRGFSERRNKSWNPEYLRAMLAATTEFNNLLDQRMRLREALKPVSHLVIKVDKEREKLEEQRQCLRFWNVFRSYGLRKSAAILASHIRSAQPLCSEAEVVLKLDDEDRLKDLLREYLTHWPEPSPDESFNL